MIREEFSSSAGGKVPRRGLLARHDFRIARDSGSIAKASGMGTSPDYRLHVYLGRVENGIALELLRQSNPAQQVGIARIGAERVVHWICIHKVQPA